MLHFFLVFAKIYLWLIYEGLFLIHTLYSMYYFPFKYIQHYVQLTNALKCPYDPCLFFLPKYVDGFPLTIESIFCLCKPSLHSLCLSLQFQQAFLICSQLLLKTHMFHNPSYLLGSDKNTVINYFLCLKVFLFFPPLCFNHSSFRC